MRVGQPSRPGGGAVEGEAHLALAAPPPPSERPHARSGGGEGGEGGGESGGEGDEGDECRREREAPRGEEAEGAGRGEREQRERERVGRRPKGWLEGAVVGSRLSTAAAVKRRRSHNSPQPPSGPAQRKG